MYLLEFKPSYAIHHCGCFRGYLDAQSLGALHKTLYDEPLKRIPYPSLYKLGFAAGGLAATGQGIAEILAGFGGEGAGLTLDATGVSALGGVALNIASAVAEI